MSTRPAGKRVAGGGRDRHWCDRTHKRCDRWALEILEDNYHWLNDYHWLLLIVIDYHWLSPTSVVTSGPWKFSDDNLVFIISIVIIDIILLYRQYLRVVVGVGDVHLSELCDVSQFLAMRFSSKIKRNIDLIVLDNVWEKTETSCSGCILALFFVNKSITVVVFYQPFCIIIFWSL